MDGKTEKNTHIGVCEKMRLYIYLNFLVCTHTTQGRPRDKYIADGSSAALVLARHARARAKDGLDIFVPTFIYLYIYVITQGTIQQYSLLIIICLFIRVFLFYQNKKIREIQSIRNLIFTNYKAHMRVRINIHYKKKVKEKKRMRKKVYREKKDEKDIIIVTK